MKEQKMLEHCPMSAREQIIFIVQNTDNAELINKISCFIVATADTETLYKLYTEKNRLLSIPIS